VLKGVIFDLDGVVVDSHPIHKRAWRVFLESLGRDANDDDLAIIFEGKKREDILRHFLGDLGPEELAAYGARKEALFSEFAHEVQTMGTVREFIALLAEYDLPRAVATSATSRRARFLLRELQLDSCFQVVTTGDDVVHGKPDPAVFLLTADRLGIAPEHLLVLEDAVCGVQAAKAAGMRCIGVASNGRGPKLLQAGADKVISQFDEITIESLQVLFS
jgi:beta-phosphoglucomutase